MPGAVFISYASQDSEAARRLCEALQAAGVEVWFDRSELRGGDSWDQKIRKQIKDCALFMPVISANTQSRDEGYFRLEWHLAEQRSHLIARGRPFIVPVCVDDTPDSEALVPDAFTAVQWMRVAGGAASPSFCERVKVLLTGGGAKALAPHVAPVAATSAPATVSRSTPRWVKPVLASAVLLAVVLAATLFRRSSHDEAKPPPSAPVPSAPVTEKLSPARQLTERARAILDLGALTRAQIDAAVELCDRAVQLDPSDPLVWVQAARADLLLIFPSGFDVSDERRKRAQERASRAASLAPDLLEVKVIQAAVFAHAVATPALITEAEKTFRALIATHPNDPELVRQLAEVLREARRFDEAAKLFESIGEYEVEGWSYYLAGELRAALPAVERSPRTVSGLELRATLQYSANEDLDAAQAVVAQFQPAELLEEMPAGVALRIAVYRRDSNRILELAQGLAPDYLASFVFNGPRRYFTGLAHEIAGRTAQAEAEWRAALIVVDKRLKASPDDRELLLWSAWLHAVLHDTAEAEKLFAHSQAIAGLPGDTMDFLNFRVLQRLRKKAALLAGGEKQLRAREPRWEMMHAEMRFSPEFDFMRDDPQFQKLLRDNLPPGAKPLEAANPSGGTATTGAASISAPADGKSIAVLPFVNRSNREEDAFFTDGIHDDLLTRISRIKNLKTISRTSVMGYRGTAKNLRQIGQELGVTTIIEGGVQRAGNQVRINVQLLDARQDKHLWAETYDRQLTAENVFAIQSEIATAIAAALQTVLAPEATQDLPTRNLEALEAYFRAKSNDGSAAQTAASIAHLERALVLDPDFAEAHALVADQYLRQVWTDGRPAAEQVEKAQPHVERALALAPQSSNAFMALGHLRHRQRKPDEAVAAFRRAIELGPNNAAAYALLGYVQLWTQRDSGAAVQSYRRALELDPLSPLIRQQMAEALSVDGKFDEARTALDQLLRDAPNAVEAVRNYGELQEHAYHRLDEAIKAYRRAVALDPKNPNFATKVALASFRVGDNTAAKFWFERALALAPQSRETSFLRGMLSLIAADPDNALTHFRTVPKEATFYGPTLDLEFYAALADGRAETAAALLAKLVTPPNAITQGNVRTESIRACLLAAANRRAETDKLIDQITEALPGLSRIGPRGYFAVDAWLPLARGDRGPALAALRALSDTGYCDANFGPNPVFKILRDDPQFQALVRINNTRLTEQRANLNRWEEAGQLAAVPALPKTVN